MKVIGWKKSLRGASRLKSALVILLFLCPAAAWGQDSPLAHVPADSAFVIHVHGVERTKDRIIALVNSAAPDLATKLGAMIDETLKNGWEGRHLRGLHKDGPHFIALTELPSGFGASPKFALILRITSYQDFVKGFLKEDEAKTLKPTDKGYDVASVDSEEHYFIDRKDYVLLTDNKDLADQLAKKGPGLDGKLKKDIAKKLLDSDVAAYVDMTAINKEYGPTIQTGRQMIGAFSGQVAEQLGKTNAELLSDVLDGVFQFVEDSTAILLTAEFHPQGLAVQLQARVGEDTKTNGYFKAAKKSPFEDLGKLPAGHLGYSAMSIAGPTAKIHQLMIQGLPGEDEKQAKEAAEELQKAGPDSWAGSFQMPPQGLQVTHYKDPAKAAAAQLKLLQGLKEGDSLLNLILKGKPEVKPDAEDYHNFKLNSVSLTWDLDKTIENQGGKQLPEESRKQMAEGMKKLVGEGSKYWFGTDGKSYVQVTAKDWDTAKGLLDEYLSGKSAISKQKAYEDARKQLPEQSTLLGLIDVLPYIQMMGDYLASTFKAMPLPVPINIPTLPKIKGEPAYLGLAISLESGQAALDFWLPASAIGEVRKLIEAMEKE
jgi:hypothetical protein